MVRGQGAGMVSREEQEIALGLENVVGAGSPNFTSSTSLHDVVEQLQSKLGFQVSHKIDFIRSHIQYLLRRPPPPPPPLPPQLYHTHKDHFALPIARPAPLPPLPTPQQSSFALHHRPSHDLSFRPHLQSQQLQFEAYTAAAAASVISPPPPTITTTTISSPTTAAAPGLAPPQRFKKSAQKVKRKRGGPGGLNKLCGVSPLLQPIVGHPTLPRTEIVKQLWIYIRKNNLQDPSNKRKIICNDELRLVFETDSTDMFRMNKLLAKHIIPLEPTKPTNRVSKKLKASVEPESKCAPESECVPESESDSKCTDFVPIVIISDELASFFGTDEKEMSQAEVLRQIWEYIKVHQLEDPSNAMVVECDGKLQELLKCKSISALGIPELLARYHLCKKPDTQLQ